MTEVKRVLEGKLKSIADSLDDYVLVDGESLTDVLAKYDGRIVKISIEVIEPRD